MISPGYYIRLRKGQKDSTETVVIEFTVDSMGAISNVHYVPPAIMSPFLLDSALEIIRFAPNWQPATITGRAVNYRQRQSITFHVSDR